MARVWQLQETKDSLSEIVEEALRSGPQVSTKHGRHTAVVPSYADYRKTPLNQKRPSDFFRDSPLAGVDPDLTRDSSPARD